MIDVRTYPELERIVSVTPYGFRFWDPVTGRGVVDGLDVAWRDDTGRRVPATHSPSGVFALRGLPWSRPFESGRGDDAFWASPPSSQPHGVVEIRDRFGRFLPMGVRLQEPERLGALTREVCRVPVSEGGGSPPQPAMPIVPLFSAPARRAPAGMAMLSADLRSVDGIPAAGAILRVTPTGMAPALGLADWRGIASVLFPYPKPVVPALSPPTPAPGRLTDQRWDGVAIQAFWDPAVVSSYPDLCDVLDQVATAPVTLLASRSPDVELTEVSLEYGKPLAVHTQGQPVLLVVPGPPPSP
jgi:hypothetical protein